MTYSIYGRMSKDPASREGAWYCLKTKVSVDNVQQVMEYYAKTWRYVERRLEC
ncbi:hypothetical protein [Enterobacter phage EC152]